MLQQAAAAKNGQNSAVAGAGQMPSDGALAPAPAPRPGGAAGAVAVVATVQTDERLLSILVCPADQGFPLLIGDEPSLQPASAQGLSHRGRHPGAAGRRGRRRRAGRA